jgi:hypothetical protein
VDLTESARAAGAAGTSWHDWIMSDEIQDVIAAAPTFSRVDQDAIEKAFGEGRRERSATTGRIVWTTAPADYDTNDATELDVVSDYFGKPLRKIAVDPEGYEYQTGRYASGTYGVWDKDPIEEDRRVRDEYAARDAERAAVEAKHKAGAEWLRTATAAELADEDLCWEHGARHQDVRAERARRHAAAQDEERTGAWARATALIPEGATLIDEGAYIPSPMVGLRPIHRPAAIRYNVKIVHGWPANDVEGSHVHAQAGRGSTSFGTVAHVADMISKGQLRVAGEGEVPPYAVADRIGVERWKDIRRVEVAGKVVWVGRAMFGAEDLVLDENGKLVRARKIVEAAKAAAAGAEAARVSKVAADHAETAQKAQGGHAWGGRAGQRTRARRRRPKMARALRRRYGHAASGQRPGGWFGDSERHSLASRKGWLKRK